MLSNERKHEFALVMSLGMNRRRLIQSTLLELLTMALLGIVSAVIVTIPIILYFHYHPIKLTGNLADTMLQYGMESVLSMDTDPIIWVSQTFIIILITCIMSIYPVRKIMKMKIIN